MSREQQRDGGLGRQRTGNGGARGDRVPGPEDPRRSRKRPHAEDRGRGDAPPRHSRHGHFELAAPWYDRVFGRSDVTALVHRLAVEPGMTVVDIGGGTGRVAERLAEIGGDVLVLDVSRAMLRRARQRNLPAAIALAETLPVPTDSVDRVVVVDAFHHFAHQAWAARELVRILRPGGRLVIEEPDLRRAVTWGIAVGEKLARMQSHFMAPGDMARLLEEAGGRVRAIEPDGWSVHLVVAKPLPVSQPSVCRFVGESDRA